MKTRKNKKYWGYHLIVDASDCIPEAIRSSKTIKEFTKELVDKIDMVAYGAPKVVRFGEGDKQGYSLVQLIETSNITAHFVEETNDIYLDIFSCKTFKQSDALAVFKKYFAPKRVSVQFLKRQAR
jgi:S-adenosylmethionine/arginine decarboxylase-like enzyme